MHSPAENNAIIWPRATKQSAEKPQQLQPTTIPKSLSTSQPSRQTLARHASLSKPSRSTPKHIPLSSKSSHGILTKTEQTSQPSRATATETTVLRTDNELDIANIFPYMCNNCLGQYKTVESFLCHYSPQRPACAYKNNEVITNLALFTPASVLKSMYERR